MRILLLIIALVLAWGPMLPEAAAAAVVGRLTQVEGRVDRLKGGKLPATPVKVGDLVDAGDVLRCKSLSKAQITFIDSSIISISPGSRLAIKDYRFEPDQGKRWAVLKIFQGLAHVVVNKIYKVEEPDFIVQTNTAVTGVRGTDFGVRLLPNRSTILNFEGKTRVGNIFPEVHTWERRARKTAYQQASGGGFFVPGAFVDLGTMQGTTVQADLPPTLPFAITPLDRELFMNQVATGLASQRSSKESDRAAAPGGAKSESGATGAGGGGATSDSGGGVQYIADLGGPGSGLGTPVSSTGTSVPAVPPTGLTGTGSTQVTLLNTVKISPKVQPQGTGTGGTSGTGDTGGTGGGGGISATGTGSTQVTLLNTVKTPPKVQPQSGTTGTGGTATTGGGGGISSSGSGGVEYIADLGGPDSGLGTPVSNTSTTVPADAPMGLTTGTGSTQVTLLNTVIIPPPVLPPPQETIISSPPPPPVEPPPPTPTPSTYSFQSTGYSAWQSTASTATSNTLSSTGWGQLTGTWPAGTFPEYHTTSSSGSRTIVAGSAYPPGNSWTGTSVGTLTGTVTGVLGSTLTGTAIATGTTAFGYTYSFPGTVVIEPSGQMTFTYTGGTLSSSYRLLSASGTTTYTPGAYFTQTLDGAMLCNSTAPYNTETCTSTWMGGSSTGGIPGYFAGTITGTDTSPWAYTYLAQEYNDLMNTSIMGVVSPTGGGNLAGAMTVFPSNQDTPFVSSLPLAPNLLRFIREGIDYPIVGTVAVNSSNQLTSTIYGGGYMDGGFPTAVYNVVETPQATPVTPAASASYDFSQTYNGAMFLTSGLAGSPANTSQIFGQGWGQRTGVYNGYFLAYDQGTWTATTGSPQVYYGSSVAVTQMSGRVTGALGQNLTGNMIFIGSLLNGTSFSYSGPVTIHNSGRLEFNYTGDWVAPGGASGTASGILNQFPGYKFTQTMTGTYQLNTPDMYNALVTLYGSGGTVSDSRTGVDPGTIGGFTGSFNLYSPDGSLPPSTSGTTDVTLEGVVGTSNLGAQTGVATLSASLNLGAGSATIGVPGSVSITPGGSYFNTGGVFVQPLNGPLLSVQSVSALTPTLAQLPLYSFSQSYNGFRISLSEAPFTLASIEGYGWGQRLGTTTATTQALPASYTGYFIAQDLGTRAAITPGSLPSNWVSLTGSMTGTVSGVAGQTLSGQMIFTGSSSTGVTYNYQGPVTLAADGSLLYYYNGNWQSASSSGTGSGSLLQVPGTYFTETASGNYQQSTTTSGPVDITAVKDATPLTGSRTSYDSNPGGTTTPTTASLAAGVTSPTAGTPVTPTGSGSISVEVQGVVAGASHETKWGVASMTPSTTPAGSTSPTVHQTITGPVVIEPSGNLTGQFVNQTSLNNHTTTNLVSVPTASGMTTSSFTQTSSGTFNQVATADGSGFTLTTPTPLTGTATGPVSGPINTNVAITSQASQPNSFGSGTGAITVNTVGTVAGPPGGTQTGVSTTQVVKTIGTNTYIPAYVGTAVAQPATATAPATVTSTLQSNMNLPPATGASNTQTGTATVTPK